MNANEESSKAMAAICELYKMAERGDKTAVVHLSFLGTWIARDLAFLAILPCSSHVIARAAAQSDEWPVAVPAIKELRFPALEKQTPANLGAELTIKPIPKSGSGGPRNFDPKTIQGFARDLWVFFDGAYGINHFPGTEQSYNDKQVFYFLSDKFADGWRPENYAEFRLEAQIRMQAVTSKAKKLPLLTNESLPEWTALGMEWADAICLGKWDDFPWPQKILDRSKTISGKFSKSPRGCKSVVKEWIKGGFSSLVATL